MHVIIFLVNLLLTTKISDCNIMYSAKRVEEEPIAVVEYYKIDDYLYMFFSERVTWNEAETICPNYDAQLAIVNTALKANKLAAAMADSNIDMEDIWIGAQRSEKGTWEWVNKKRISSKSVNGFPPWVRNPNRPLKQCVALHRYAIDLPLFVDLNCRLSKPFICQRDADTPENPDVALPSHVVTHEKSTYILYHSRVTWATAAAFCRIRGYRLAIIPNNEIAKVVSTAMIRSRPSFENVWISGHFYHNKWTWLPTGDTMQSHPNENNYPPWHHNSTHQTSGCLLMDRHVCADPVFLALSCDHKRDFVCEKYAKSPEHHKKPKIREIPHKNVKLQLHLQELSWNKAQEYCKSENGRLADIYDYKTLKAIATVMSDQESEPVHVWLGGILINDTWMWATTNNTVPLPSDKKNFMPWCDIEQKEGDDCLNMDREEHDKPVIYGLDCEMKQPFVCSINTNFKPRSGKRAAIPFRRNSSSLNLFFTEHSYESSLQQCNKAGGKLATLNKDDINALSDTLLDSANNISGDQNFWTNSESKCSQLNLGRRAIEVPSSCLRKQAFICVPNCTTPNLLDASNTTKWICDSADGFECRIECKGNTVLVGPETITCNDFGWVTGSNTINYLPFCQSSEYATRKILDFTENERNEYQGFLFVMDESHSVNLEEWKIQLQFIASMVQVFPLSTSWTMGLLLFSSRVRIPIPFQATDTCEVLKILSKLVPDEERDYTFIKEALEEANNQIRKYHNDQPTIIYIISDGEGNRDDFDEIMRSLKKKHLIISIGISVDPLKDLADLASVADDELLMYNFQKFTFFKQHTLDLMKQRSKEVHCSDNLYSVFQDVEKPKAMKVRKRQYSATNETDCDYSPSSIELKGVTYTTYFVKSTYEESELHCINHGGRLTTLKDNQVEDIVNSVTKKRAESCDDEKLWINKSRSHCVTLQVKDKRIHNCTDLDKFKKLSFVCENGCPNPPTDGEYMYTNWNCNTLAKHKHCHVKCKGKTVLVGASMIICTPTGWATLNNLTTNFPLCLTLEAFEDEFIKQISKLKEEYGGFIFVFDQNSKHNGTSKQLDFMKIILEIFPPSENFPIGLILLEEKPKVVIPFNETNFCLIRRKLHHLKHSATVYSLNDHENLYNEAFLEVDNQIVSLQSTRRALIFLIADHAIGGNYTNALLKLKQKHSMFTIGSNYDGLKDLNFIASKDSHKLLMYTFKSSEHLAYTMKIIKQHRGKHYKCAGEDF